MKSFNLKLLFILIFTFSVFTGCAGDDGGQYSNNYSNNNNVNNTSSNNWNSLNNVNNTNNSINNSNNTNNTNNINTTNNLNNNNSTNKQDPHDLMCADATTVETTFYMSADDSNSQAQPVVMRSLGVEYNYFWGAPREYEYLNYYTFNYTPAEAGSLRIVPELSFNTSTGEYEFLVGVVSPQVTISERRGFNFTFSVDTSGSMGGEAIANVKHTMLAIAAQLREGDIVNVVSWGDTQNILLNNHVISSPNDPVFVNTINNLSPGGSTNLHDGLITAYQLARANYRSDFINRVFLLSDGGANVGVTDENLIAAETQYDEGEGIFMIGVGSSSYYSYDHSLMDTITDVGKGAYIYIDTAQEAEKMFGADRILSNVDVAALNVKLQVTLPPQTVIAEFHGEQISQVPEEVIAQHLAPNDAMMYHSNLLFCGDEGLNTFTGDEVFHFTVTWLDPITHLPNETSMEISVSDLLTQENLNLEKASILVEYARAIVNADGLQTSVLNETKTGLLARINAYEELTGDPDMAEIRTVLNSSF